MSAEQGHRVHGAVGHERRVRDRARDCAGRSRHAEEGKRQKRAHARVHAPPPAGGGPRSSGLQGRIAWCESLVDPPAAPWGITPNLRAPAPAPAHCAPSGGGADPLARRPRPRSRKRGSPPRPAPSRTVLVALRCSSSISVAFPVAEFVSILLSLFHGLFHRTEAVTSDPVRASPRHRTPRRGGRARWGIGGRQSPQRPADVLEQHLEVQRIGRRRLEPPTFIEGTRPVIEGVHKQDPHTDRLRGAQRTAHGVL